MRMTRRTAGLLFIATGAVVLASPFVVAADRVPLTVGGKGRFVESEYAGP